MISSHQEKILYVGQLKPGGTSGQRLQGLAELGCQLRTIKVTLPGARSRVGLLRKASLRGSKIYQRKLINSRLPKFCEESGAGVLWLDKYLGIDRATLTAIRERVPGITIVFYSPDDMSNPSNQSVGYLESIPEFDLIVTTKSYNVPELRSSGARNVMFLGNAYAPEVHRPYAGPESFPQTNDIGFIGDYEEERFCMMQGLARDGLKVDFYCPKLNVSLDAVSNLVVHQGFLANDQYASAIWKTKINLGFLRKVNRDLQTTRSIEIPACGGFMLAERTEEHLALFEEGKEAEYFASYDELLDKCRYYLKHENERQRIAKNGRERCVSSGYSNKERLKSILGEISAIENNP